MTTEKYYNTFGLSKLSLDDILGRIADMPHLPPGKDRAEQKMKKEALNRLRIEKLNQNK